MLPTFFGNVINFDPLTTKSRTCILNRPQ